MKSRRRRGLVDRLLRRAAVVAAVGLIAGGLGVPPAMADTQPPVSGTPLTVSSDGLPTVQVDGVVWAQIVVGNTVYVTGNFANARPAGSAAGTNLIPRANILAYDITTGVLNTTFAPSLNAQGLGLVASPDGQTIYVGGDFTQVNGQSKYRVAALDATTGALRNFSAAFNARVRGLAISGTTLFVGGNFSTASNQTRTRLAAYNTGTSALLPWAPSASAEVYSLATHAGSNKVFVAGKYTSMNGQTTKGMAALDMTTGATQPFEMNTVATNGGTAAGYYSVKVVGSTVFGTGWSFNGSQGNFENVFTADAVTGNLIWISGCRGDTYDVAPIADVVYFVSHSHDCSMIGAFPQRSALRAEAFRVAPVPGKVNSGGAFSGRPAPELMTWQPYLDVGSFTGQDQAAWTSTGTAQYVVLGGEFPKVNGVGQQGLVRFATRDIAPNKDGPVGFAEITPTLTGIGPGTVRASFIAAYDRDNTRLRYELLRGATLGTSTVAASLVYDNNIWTRPGRALVDSGAPGGSSQTYRVRVTDPYNNVMVSTPVTTTVPDGTAPASGPYQSRVLADSPTQYWPLNEASGTTAINRSAANDLTLPSNATRNVPGIAGSTATTFPGNNTLGSTSGSIQTGPQVFSLEAWFNTTTNAGGKIVGFGNAASGVSSSYDRNIYMTNSGQLVFGIYDGSTRVLTSPLAYRDGNWHHVVGTFANGALVLYLDGQQVATRTDAGTAQGYDGYWRVGGDNLNSWPSTPSSRALAGTLDEVAVYPTVLSAQAVSQHYTLGTGGTVNQTPVAAFTATPSPLAVSVDGSTSSDPDGTIASYAWNFGDGGTATGATANHTYTAPGTFTVALTVTDNGGATNTTSRQVTITANQNPVAAFTSTSNALVLSVNGSASSDPDGTVASYAWNFGDGGTATGATATHTYATPGTYTVGLTVTDNLGATNATSQQVTVTPANQNPVAAFTATPGPLSVAVDGSTSSDPDGTVASFAWNFGDGGTATGATATHTYTAGGTYTVALTVTDNAGATNATSQQVAVPGGSPGTPVTVAADAFGRTVATGLGNADVGGAWTHTGAGSATSVADGSGRVSVNAGRSALMRLGAVSNQDTILTETMWVESMPTGGGVYLAGSARSVGPNEYRGRIRILSDGQVQVSITKLEGGTETVLTNSVVVQGLTYTAGRKLVLRTQAVGVNPTTISVKVWAADGAEPATWQRTVTDSSAALQAPGAVSLYAFNSGSASAPAVVRFDDLTAVRPGV